MFHPTGVVTAFRSRDATVKLTEDATVKGSDFARVAQQKTRQTLDRVRWSKCVGGRKCEWSSTMGGQRQEMRPDGLKE